MATFNGNNNDNTAHAAAGILIGFTGGTLAQLQDGIGDTINGLGGNDFIFAGSGNDIINAGAASESGSRHDIVIGGAGSDTFNVDAANSETTIVIYSFEGGAGAVTANLQTGTATDTFGNNDTLNGVRFLVATDGNDTLTGSSEDDILAPGRGTDVVDGNGGNDTLAYYFISDGQGGGSDGFDFTAGITVNMSGEDAGTVTSTDGVNTTFTNMDIIIGTRFGDVFNGNTGDDEFEGGEGDDEFNGGDGTDSVSYHREYVMGGISGVFVDLANNTATDSFGDTDTLNNIENVTGTQFGDQLEGDGANNDLQGLGGNDFIRGGAGNDIIDAGNAENDGFRHDVVVGDAGDDTFNVEAENAETTILAYVFETGGSGVIANLQTGTATDTFGNNDTLNGVRFLVATDNNDNLTGSLSDDVLAPGRGTDIVDGNGGNDTLAYYFISDGQGGGSDGFDFLAGITVNMTGDNAGTVTSTDGVNTTFSNIAFIAGTRHADIFNGGAGDDDFKGGEGDDTFNGGGGTDHVSFTSDLVGGGPGGATVNLSTGVGTDPFGDTDAYSSIENLTGTQFADNFTGNGNSNSLQGLGGNDVLNGGVGDDDLGGGAGNDTLDGGAGNDTLNGGAGNDTYLIDSNGDTIIDSGGVDTVRSTITKTLGAGLEHLTLLGSGALNGTGNAAANTLTGTSGNNTLSGLGGNDILTGGKGRDTLSGGADKDFFDFNSIQDTVKGSNRDRIMDFKRSQGDKIDLEDIDAQSGSGNQKFTFIGTKDFSDKKGQLRYDDKGSTVIVQGDINGDGKADFEIFVKVSSLAKGDFVL